MLHRIPHSSTRVIVRHPDDSTDEGTPKLLIDTLGWDARGWPKY